MCYFKKFYNKSTKFIKKLFISKDKDKLDLDQEINNNPMDDVICTQINTNLNEFVNKVAADVMIPRSDIIAIDINSNFKELMTLVLKYSHTRLLVYQNHLDNVIGFIHIKDLFKLVLNLSSNSLRSANKKSDKKISSIAHIENIEDIDIHALRNKNLLEEISDIKLKTYLKLIIRKNIVSPYSMQLSTLLEEMKRRQTHIAIIVDEYGSIDGIVTIEDIIESIIGKIDDEHDLQDTSTDYKFLNENTILTNARLEISTLQQITAIEIEDNDEFDTIGGLILYNIGRFPKQGEQIKINDNLSIKITKATPRVIHEVKITFKKEQIED